MRDTIIATADLTTQAVGIIGRALENLGTYPFYLWLTLVTFAMVFLVIMLSKNTTLTEALATRIADTETAGIVKEIRSDQLISNEERKQQAIKITDINERLCKVEQTLNEHLAHVQGNK